MVAAPFVISRVRAEQPFSLIDHPLALTQALLVAQNLELHWNVAFAVDRYALARQVGAPPRHTVTALMALDGDGTRATAPYPPWVQLF